MMNAAAITSEIGQPRSHRDLGEAGEAQKRAACERTGHERTDQARSFAIRVRLPGMKGRQAHLRSEPGQREHVGCAEPRLFQRIAFRQNVVENERAHAGEDWLRGGQEEHGEERERDTN
jgi:hypothetical protein